MSAATAFLALVLLALASADTCVAPYSGQNVSSFQCSQAGATLSLSRSPRWDANFGGQIVVTGTSFCLNVSSVALSDGEPAITLAPCDPGSPITPFQLFAPLSSGANSSYASHVDGSCLDLVSGSEAPGEQLELYGCSGNPNQCVLWRSGRPLSCVPHPHPFVPRLLTLSPAGSFPSRAARWW